MKYCKNCGAEIQENAVICPSCGCQVRELEQQKTSGLAIAALVFSILGGWLGLVLDIIGLCTLKADQDRRYCKIGLIISIVFIVIEIVIIIVSVAAMASLVDGSMAMQAFV